MDEQHIANENAPRRRRRAAAQEKAFEAFRMDQELEQKVEQEAVVFPTASEEEPPHFEKSQVDWLDDEDVFDETTDATDGKRRKGRSGCLIAFLVVLLLAAAVVACAVFFPEQRDQILGSMGNLPVIGE